jgi:hypothetical protein
VARIVINSYLVDGTIVDGNILSGTGAFGIEIASPGSANSGMHIVTNNTVTGFGKSYRVDMLKHPGTYIRDGNRVISAQDGIVFASGIAGDPTNPYTAGRVQATSDADTYPGFRVNFSTPTSETAFNDVFHLQDGRFVLHQQAANPSAAQLTSGSNAKDRTGFYMKNGKIVFAYNNAGAVNYLVATLDGSTATWTNSASAP